MFALKFYEIFKIQSKFESLLRLKKKRLAAYNLIQLFVWLIYLCHLFACFFYGVGSYQLRVHPD